MRRDAPRLGNGHALHARGDLRLGLGVARRRKDDDFFPTARAQEDDEVLPLGRELERLLGVVIDVEEVLGRGGLAGAHLDRAHRLGDDRWVDAHPRRVHLGPVGLQLPFWVGRREDLARELPLGGADRRQGVALLVEFAMVGAVVVIRVGRGEARVEARDGVEERPKARAEGIGRRLGGGKVQDLMRYASVNVLVDHVDNRHRVGVRDVWFHVDDGHAAIGTDELVRDALHHLHVALEALQDAEHLGGADHVHRRGGHQARGFARKLGIPGEDLLGGDEVGRQATNLLGDRGRDVVVGHAHRGHAKPKERAQRRRAVRGRVRRIVQKPRILDGDDAEALACGRDAAHG